MTVKCLLYLAMILGGCLAAAAAQRVSPAGNGSVVETSRKSTDLYTEGPGANPSFQELIDQGKVEVGSKEGGSIPGTKIKVNHQLLESGMDEVNGTEKPDSIHTHVKSGIPRKQFDQWSRWYQEDGNTQIFRLFKGEQSVRSLNNIKAGRIEAVKTVRLPAPGTWVEWQGTYTIIKPGGGCIFQIMVGKDPESGEGGLWPVHLGMSREGSIVMTRRRPKGKEKKEVVVAKDVIGKSVTMKVRFDGKSKYDAYRKIHGQDDDFVFVGAGSYTENHSDKVGFRWGIYQGSKPGSSIREDCLLFVTGVKISYVKRPESSAGSDMKNHL
jgi:hypothetical protein